MSELGAQQSAECAGCGFFGPPALSCLSCAVRLPEFDAAHDTNSFRFGAGAVLIFDDHRPPRLFPAGEIYRSASGIRDSHCIGIVHQEPQGVAAGSNCQPGGFAAALHDVERPFYPGEAR